MESEPNSVSLDTELLAKELGYDPSRRFENRAGFAKITPKQLAYINRLKSKSPSLFSQIYTVLSEYWGVSDIEDWTVSDGMFAINKLLGE